MSTPYEEARKKFDSLLVCEDSLSELQVMLAAWKNEQLPGTSHPEYLGTGEEIGELSECVLGLMAAYGKLNHIRLKTDQKIRGYGDIDKLREETADAIADIAIFQMQLCTLLRLDYETLVKETARKIVLKRNWNANSEARPSV